MKKIKNVHILLLCVMLGGCAKSTIEAHKLREDQGGIIWGSMSYEGDYADYQLHFKNIHTGESGFITFGSNVNEHGIFAMTVPKGVYRVTGWRVSQQYISKYSDGETRKVFNSDSSAPTYLGKFHFTSESAANSPQANIQASISNRYAADLKMWRMSYPDINTPWHMAEHLPENLPENIILCEACDVQVIHTPAQIR
ncbi:hypothetical protein JF50_18845 [Pseudoalteromonas luteoviolacea]|uniref:Carboxypeptidase regulatory-like domain-containing protein n=1 Tax=Pseudoalteromonas luteoviolacea TaxID=43657 RepID=A0A0C1Q6M4_9GAMM|nr:hypothetical protein [Pseudoalteromonas luteoviolacea]KID56306.1 hypothetical protein JF50_18845 [Pseudoalteromonas luteoviolacea]